MERLRARTDEGDPPEIRYDIQPVMVVGDQSSLVPFLCGPRATVGCLVPAGGAGVFGGLQVRAGSRGVFLSSMFTTVATPSNLTWRLLAAPSAGFAPLGAALPLGSQNPASAGLVDTKVFRGSYAVNPFSATDPQVPMLSANIVWPPAPWFWLEPGRVMEFSNDPANIGFQVAMFLEEPAMEPQP